MQFCFLFETIVAKLLASPQLIHLESLPIQHQATVMSYMIERLETRGNLGPFFHAVHFNLLYILKIFMWTGLFKSDHCFHRVQISLMINTKKIIIIINYGIFKIFALFHSLCDSCIKCFAVLVRRIDGGR